MTKQEIIDVINRDFKGKAVNLIRKCVYKTYDGKKCAIGLFIPENHEAQKSTTIVKDLLQKYPDLKKHMPSDNLEVLENFQEKHDNLDENSPLEKQKKILINFVNSNF